MQDVIQHTAKSVDISMINQLYDELKTLRLENYELKKEQTIYSTMLNPPNIIIYINDLIQEKKLWSNKNYEYLTGYTVIEANKMGSRYFQEAYHKDDTDLFRLSKNQTMKGHLIKYQGVYRFKHKNGKYMWFCSFIRPFKYNTKDNPWLLLGVAIHITDSINKEEKLCELIKENYRLKYKGINKLLSFQEKKVLKRIAQGYSSKEIADHENLSCHTIETHRKNILKKLEIKNTAELIRIASHCELI